MFLTVDHALKEIQFYQNQTACLIPRRPFIRLCREVLDNHGRKDLKVSASAFAAMQQVGEAIVVLFFELCNKAAIHAKRVTVMPRDSTFVKDFIRTIDPTNPIGQSMEWKAPMAAQTDNIIASQPNVVPGDRPKIGGKRPPHSSVFGQGKGKGKGKEEGKVGSTKNKPIVRKGVAMTKPKNVQGRH